MTTPYLSVVATTRNDDHGGDLKRRTQIFINGLVALAERHRLPTELLLVEWNPPPDRPRMAEAFSWPASTEYCAIRIIEVPPRLHQRYQHGQALPLYQMIGKNVGLRRARAPFVLATNIDILFTDELMAYLATRPLKRDRMYRVDRLDVEPDVPLDAGIDTQLEYCRQHLRRILEWGGTQDFRTGLYDMIYPELARFKTTGPAEGRGLHTNACGDFTLMARENWAAVRGYPEFDMYSFHLDSILCYQAHYAGAREEALAYPLAVYHIEHGAGWTPEQGSSGALWQRLQAKGIPFLGTADLNEFIRRIIANQGPLLLNGPAWGLGEERLPERDIRRPRAGKDGKGRAKGRVAEPASPAAPENAEPYLSIVVAGRNDDHGAHLLARTQRFLDSLDHQCQLHGLDAELLFVEWNPPAERPSLAQALAWPAPGRRLQVRLLQVPPELHQGLENSDKLAFFQMIAKNVAIRRARGRFVLATNIDILFSDELMAFLARRELDPAKFYRVDRFDLEDRLLPDLPSHRALLAYCGQRVIRVHRQESRPLHTNACGDFTLMAREHWLALRGHPELKLYSIYIDGVTLFMAAAAGLRQEFLADPLRIFHIEHDNGWAVTQDMVKTLPSLDFQRDYMPWCARMMEQRRPLNPNDEQWGLADQPVRELPAEALHVRKDAPATPHPREAAPLPGGQADQDPALTIFAMPRPFTGLTGVMQRNAITSWALLRPRPQIILFGQAEGTAEMAAELGLRHEKEVPCDSSGRPLLSGLFQRAGELAACDTLAYLQTNLILLADFLPVVERIRKEFPSWIALGRSLSLDLAGPLDFAARDWEETLRGHLSMAAKKEAVCLPDYLVFSKAWIAAGVPDFTIDQFYGPRWMVTQGIMELLPIVDATEAITAVHQEDSGFFSPQMVFRQGWLDKESPANYRLADVANLVDFFTAPTLAADNRSLRKLKRKPSWRWVELIKQVVGPRVAVMLKEGQWETALSDMDHLEEHLEHNWFVDGLCHNRAVCLFRLGRLRQARVQALRQLVLFPDTRHTAQVLTDINAALAARQDPAAGRGAGDFVAALIAEGEDLFQRGDLEKAERCFWTVLNRHPQNVEALNDLALTMWRKGQRDPALHALEKSLAIKPDYRDSAWNLGQLLWMAGARDKAREVFQQFLVSHPDDQDISAALSQWSQA